MENLPLIVSDQVMVENALAGWMGRHAQPLNVVATYNLLFNASILVREKVGYALCIDNIINTGESTDFEFRPFEPPLKVGLHLVWKKHQMLGKAPQKFLEQVHNSLLKH